MKKLLILMLVFSALIFITGCEESNKDDSTTAVNQDTHRIDPTLIGSWDLYKYEDARNNIRANSAKTGTSNDERSYPSLNDEAFFVLASDSLVVDTKTYKFDDKSIFHVEKNQIFFEENSETTYLYDYYLENNQLWLKADVSSEIDTLFIDSNTKTLADSLSDDILVLFKSDFGPKVNLITPLNNSILRFKPIISWDLYKNNGTELAKSYLIQISESQDFETVIVDSEVVAGTDELDLSYQLDNLKTYYWKVKADTSGWSETRFFSTDFLPVLDSDILESLEEMTLTPYFEWEYFDSDYQTTKFKLEIATDNVFSNIICSVDNLDYLYQMTTALDMNKKYYLRIGATDGNYFISEIFTGAKVKVVGTYMLNDDYECPTNPEFKWVAYSGANSYTLEVASDTLFTEDSIILKEENITDNVFTFSTPLETNTIYRWRVRSDITSYCDYRSFNTNTYVTLNEPIIDSLGIDPIDLDNNITFKWEKYIKIRNYKLYVMNGDIEEFSVDVTSSSAEIEYEMPDTLFLEWNTQYNWYAVAIDDDVEITTDDHRSTFTTRNGAELLLPEDGEQNVGSIVGFKWASVIGDNDYRLVVSSDSLHQNIVLENDVTLPEDFEDSEIEFVPTQEFTNNETYFWKILVNGEDSETRSFTVSDEYDASINTVLISPVNWSDENDDIGRITSFVWEETFDALVYWFQISNSLDFTGELVLDQQFMLAGNGGGNSALLEDDTALDFGETYYWRARSDLKNWSEIRQIHVRDSKPEDFIVDGSIPHCAYLTWAHIANIGTYRIERKTSTEDWTEIGKVSSMYKKYCDFGLESGMEYTYRVYYSLAENNEDPSTMARGVDSDEETITISSYSISPIDIIPITVDPNLSFTMGSDADSTSNEYPAHEVTLTKDFNMSKYEITNKQFVEVLNYAFGMGYINVGEFDAIPFYTGGIIKPSEMYDIDGVIEFDQYDLIFSIAEDQVNNIPVIVTFKGAITYTNWLTELTLQKDGIYNLNNYMMTDLSKTGYRLATEAEWEFVARKGHENTSYPWGDATPSQSHANYYDSGWGNALIDVENTCESGATSDGIYHLAGNAWEWLSDKEYEYTSEPKTDPVHLIGKRTAIRGGSFEYGVNDLRSTNRAFTNKVMVPTREVTYGVGIRLVRID